MVKQITLHKFVTQKGYDLIEREGKLKTSQLLGISRPTIDAILKKYPEPPKKTLPKYVFQWEETEGNKVFIAKMHGRLRHLERYVQKGVKAWLLLDRKDPIDWSVGDYRRIWQAEEFKDSATGKMEFVNAVIFRVWMRATGKAQFCGSEEFSTRGLKRLKGSRKQWYLEDEDIARLIGAIDDQELLVAFVAAILSGGRASSIMPRGLYDSKGVSFLDINFRKNTVTMFEPKRQEHVVRFFHPKAIELFKRFCEESKKVGSESIFHSYETLRIRLKIASRKCGLSKIANTNGTWHIAKHTFVTQGAYHGLSLEVISEQTGTDANTLMEYYAGMKEKKMRLELLGEKVDIEPFHSWALRVIIKPAFRKYESLTLTKN